MHFSSSLLLATSAVLIAAQDSSDGTTSCQFINEGTTIIATGTECASLDASQQTTGPLYPPGLGGLSSKLASISSAVASGPPGLDGLSSKLATLTGFAPTTSRAPNVFGSVFLSGSLISAPTTKGGNTDSTEVFGSVTIVDGSTVTDDGASATATPQTSSDGSTVTVASTTSSAGSSSAVSSTSAQATTSTGTNAAPHATAFALAGAGIAAVAALIV